MSNDQVTILIYTFPLPGSEAAAFARIQSSIERTWNVIGERPTVIVASHHFSEVDVLDGHVKLPHGTINPFGIHGKSTLKLLAQGMI